MNLLFTFPEPVSFLNNVPWWGWALAGGILLLIIIIIIAAAVSKSKKKKKANNDTMMKINHTDATGTQIGIQNNYYGKDNKNE